LPFSVALLRVRWRQQCHRLLLWWWHCEEINFFFFFFSPFGLVH
jgi:hypothetical protein